MDEPRIATKQALPYLAVRCEITEGVPAAIDAAFPKFMQRLGERGVALAQAPFIRILEVDEDGEPLLLECGAPVAAGTDGEGDVYAAELPAGRYVTATHVGAYRSEDKRDLGDARAELLDWMEREGIAYSRPRDGGGEVIACGYDQLHVSPPMEPDFTKWETELAYLVIDA